MAASQFEQAPVNRAKSHNEANIHVQKLYNFLVHPHVPKFLVDTTPQLAPTIWLRLSYPVIEFDDHRSAGRRHLSKRSDILGTTFVGSVVLDESQAPAIHQGRQILQKL